MTGVFVKMILCGILAHVIVSAKKHAELTNNQILKIVHLKNMFNILALPHEDEVLNTTETLANDKKVMY